MKRGIIKLNLIMVITIITTLLTPVNLVATEKSAEYTEYASNNRFKLMINETSGVFYVEDRGNGERWYSSPKDCESDRLAKGKFKMDMYSALIINYANPDIGNINTSNSYTASVRKHSLKVFKVRDGVCFLYQFPDEGFVIPLYVELNTRGFSVRIPLEEVTESGLARLYDIHILPYIGAGSFSDEGFLLVPDGSGAIIRFNNDKHSYSSYQQKVYGRDIVFNLEQKRNTTQPIRLPVFGIKRNNAGLFAIISDGDALASINADVAGKKTGYNNVYASFSIRGMDTHKMGQNLGIAVKTTNILQKCKLPDTTLKIEYIALRSYNNGYSGMAAACREYYEKAGILKHRVDGSTPLFLELLGGIEKVKSFLGIPIRQIEEMTTFNEATQILHRLQGLGVGSIYLKYNNWSDAAIRGKPQARPSASTVLGGNESLGSLVRNASGLGTKVFLTIDPTRVRRWNVSYTRWNSSTRTVAQTQAVQYEYNKATYFKDSAVSPCYLVRPTRLPDLASDYRVRIDDIKDVGISSDGLADILYSDFSKKHPVDRQEASLYVKEATRILAGDEGLLTSGGNSYAFLETHSIIDAPLEHSQFDIEDEQVPFYQMVLHGYIYYSGSALNLSDDVRLAMLGAIETGSMLHFYLAADNNEKLMGTKYDDIFSIDTSTWEETAAMYYAEIRKVDVLVYNRHIIDYERLTPNVSCTKYEGGISVYVNKSHENFLEHGIMIPARGYRIIGGE